MADVSVDRIRLFLWHLPYNLLLLCMNASAGRKALAFRHVKAWKCLEAKAPHLRTEEIGPA